MYLNLYLFTNDYRELYEIILPFKKIRLKSWHALKPTKEPTKQTSYRPTDRSDINLSTYLSFNV